jgi:hypothetical protein
MIISCLEAESPGWSSSSWGCTTPRFRSIGTRRWRPNEERFGGLTVEEQPAIDTLMKPYRRVWGDSPVLRRYERIPHGNAHAVAQKVFDLACGIL